MASSRDTILSAIRSRSVPSADLPTQDCNGIRYPDPERQFGEVLASVGGRLLIAEGAADANRQLSAIPEYAAASKICSLVEGIGVSNVSLDQIDDPHALQDLDFAILRGEFAVAENGAVWLTDAGVRHRVLPFIPQHLILVVPADQLVHNMHEAYTRLKFSDARFGVFISGPSKTADIEQSLVIGAHGPRSLAVIFLK